MSGAQALFVALTIDVDPDANRAVPGRPDAVTAGDHRGGARLDACLEGLRQTAHQLDALQLPATFFWEARSLETLRHKAPAMLDRLKGCERFEHANHSYQHEDFSGRGSGAPLDLNATMAVLKRAQKSHEKVFGLPATGFRAPYCVLTDELTIVLERLGFDYDASETRRPSCEWPLTPYALRGTAVRELALSLWRDQRGKTISGYLWQLFEGNRCEADYLALVEPAKAYAGGLLQFAWHPWHLTVSENNQPLDRRDVDGIARLGHFLRELAAREGLSFTTLADYLQRQGPAR